MRKKNQITQLETQVSELMAVVNSLLEIVTKPTEPAKIKIETTTPIRKNRLGTEAKARTRWTMSEQESLIVMFSKGISYEDIAKILGRSKKACEQQMSNIRLGK